MSSFPELWSKVLKNFGEEAGDPPSHGDLDAWEVELITKLLADAFNQEILYIPKTTSLFKSTSEGADAEGKNATAVADIENILEMLDDEGGEGDVSLQHVKNFAQKELWNGLLTPLRKFEAAYDKYLQDTASANNIHNQNERHVTFVRKSLDLYAIGVYENCVMKNPHISVFFHDKKPINREEIIHEAATIFATVGKADKYERCLKELSENFPKFKEDADRQLAILLIQQKREDEAVKLLDKNHFKIRFHSDLFRYFDLNEADLDRDQREDIFVFDDCLPNKMFKHLKNVFDVDFFKQHSYDCFFHGVSRKFGYFSYFHDLTKPSCSIDYVLKKLVDDVFVHDMPELKKAKYAELWTHRRPASGSYHQLHFDSENEGIGGVKNPIATFVMFLEASEDMAPTVITDQTRDKVTETLHSANAFLCWPKENRAICFHGNLLHGVVPGAVGDVKTLMNGKVNGAGNGQHHNLNTWKPATRHTLMFSFWEELECRKWPKTPNGTTLSEPGACRPVAGCPLPWTSRVLMSEGDFNRRFDESSFEANSPSPKRQKLNSPRTSPRISGGTLERVNSKEGARPPSPKSIPARLDLNIESSTPARASLIGDPTGSPRRKKKKIPPPFYKAVWQSLEGKELTKEVKGVDYGQVFQF